MVFPSGWQAFIKAQKNQAYFSQLTRQITEKRQEGVIIYPEESLVFKAFSGCDVDQVKVVILGQDPYHGHGQACGLAFSVPTTEKVPPSLRNIFKELQQDINGFKIPSHGDISVWAEQGVLLLNTVLTVEQGMAHSHAKLGWEIFTDHVITEINERNPHCVFILWGNHAQKKGKNINADKHLVLKGVHPSPLSASRGFFGCQHFSKTNTWLQEQGMTPIDWRVSDDCCNMSLF